MRLTEIIRTNSQGVNEIVENVLQLSRRRESQPELLDLQIWLKTFVDEFSTTMSASGRLQFVPSDDTAAVHFDPGQLRQVLWNLCENGLRHSVETGSVGVRIGKLSFEGRW